MNQRRLSRELSTARRSERLHGPIARRGRGLPVAALLLAAVLAAPTASASPDTLRLALEDMIMGAADLVVSPVNAGKATLQNLDDVSSNSFLQALYVLPGFVGLSLLQAGQASLRILVGALEVLPGLALFPFEADLSEDVNVFRRGTLMADYENPLGKTPPWLSYVLPVTPITIDARIGPMCPWALYVDPSEEEPTVHASR